MRRGFTLVELLVAIMVSSIILLAIASLFMGSNRAFRVNRDVAEMSEDVRNAITTLEFIFSRWGAGVPCANNNCNITNSIPDCTGVIVSSLNNSIPPTYAPPSDPMCMSVISELSIGQPLGQPQVSNTYVIFYANLYGIGFVVSTNGNNANVLSCRLSSNQRQNCYYVWRNGNVKGSFYTDNHGNTVPVPVRLSQFSGQPDCIQGHQVNLTINTAVNRIVNAGDDITLEPGDYITRVPHRVTIYLSNNQERTPSGVTYRWLLMDRVDLAQACNDTETAIRIGRVQNFSVQRQGRSVVVNATFVSADGRTYPITRIYGR
ncbi:prepilin-type N-terminal cleavage/methylation domain-containing protein [Hydrogenobacter sp. T-2]|uniref:PilW family protein n=1 Tax=Pampinifervens diazotrophicum TaxID=1632018 RepID=UPI002B25714B|nr:prepilin-type N-terminal cleavage/methylation domain-containing protein [Hydrogenobacter sp. T-2]WPM32989.1 prepilin-type N-terminal cleavage/methylation domain-containing protein [Hydrogenobacter sp. T-2]